MTQQYTIGNVIISQADIERRAEEIGRRISEDFAGQEVTLIGILRGAVMWMSQVLKSIDVDTNIDFMAVSSYGSATKSSGVVKINKDLDDSIVDKNVIIVEDIVDSGITLNYLKEYLLGMNPKTLRICALLDKPAGRKKPIDVDYIGFEVGDVFIVGYGLDIDQKYRNLPYVTSIAEEIKKEER